MPWAVFEGFTVQRTLELDLKDDYLLRRRMEAIPWLKRKEWPCEGIEVLVMPECPLKRT